MTIVQKIATGIAALGILLSALGKILQGEAPNWTEITLAVSTISAAIGFQRKS